MESTIRTARIQRGISTTELARRLRVTPSAITQMERSEREQTIKLATLRAALAALGAELTITVTARNTLSAYAPANLAQRLSDELQQSNEDYALRLLTHAINELQQRADELGPEIIDAEPIRLPDPRWDTLMRAGFAHAFGDRAPAWTDATPLSEPWHVSRFPSLQRRAERTTPDWLREKNILLDERSLARA